MYYIGTQEQCEAYNAEVTEAEGYNGTTLKWAEVREHPTDPVWVVKAHPSYESELEMVEELPAPPEEPLQD